MNKKILLLPAAAACIAVAFAGKNDPIVMTVGTIEVPRSEFEYLYNKNAQQQLGSQSIDEYAELFELYKMKVADAVAEGLDTTSSFLNEFKGYRSELAAPYLTDSTYIKSLMAEAYDRAGREVEAIHIMKFKQRDPAMNESSRAQLDSIRDVIVNKGGDFGEMAKKYSEDKGSASRGGNMGYIPSPRFPYNFETAAYTLGEGEVSEIVESPQGYHLLLGGKKRPARGKVLAEHILILVPDTASDSGKADLKARIDSIYNVAVAGGDFEDLARRYSQDPGSASKGGALPWFGPGQMVAEFDSTAFAMPVGEICRPFRTNFGWHIIKKLDAQGIPSFEEMKPMLLQAINVPQDARAAMIREHYVMGLRNKYKFREFPEVDRQLIDYATTHGVDSVFFERFGSTPEFADQTVMTFTGGKRTVGDFVKSILKYHNTANPEAAGNFVAGRLNGWKNGQLQKYEDSQLEANYPEFRNLVNEYHDGMLLFEVSNRKVWEKAAADTEGLEKFFEANRGDYTWTVPHVKGYLIQTESPELSDTISKALAGVPADEIVKFVRDNYADKAKIERVLTKKGDSPMVDALVFGGDKVLPSNSKFTDCFLYDYKVIDQPEEVNDVRGQVTSDYQNELEQEWVRSLKEKYPVKINEKEFKKMKKDAAKKAKK